MRLSDTLQAGMHHAMADHEVEVTVVEVQTEPTEIRNRAQSTQAAHGGEIAILGDAAGTSGIEVSEYRLYRNYIYIKL